MKVNVGSVDRYLRVTVGFIIAAIGLYNESWWGLLAIPAIATGILGYCGLYSILGISTCKVKTSAK